MKSKNNCQKTFNDILIGDILNVKNEIIVHHVNCQYVMGAGLAGGDWEIVKNIIKNTIPTAKIILKRS